MANSRELDRDFPVNPNNRDAQNGHDPNHPELLAIRAIQDRYERLNAECLYFGISEASGTDSRKTNSNANKPR